MFSCAPARVERTLTTPVAALEVAAPDHRDVRHLAQLGVADARLHALARLVVHLRAQPGGTHAVAQGGDVLDDLGRVVLDGDDLALHGGEPQREVAGVVLGEDADEPLQRAQQGAVDHDRRVVLARRHRRS